MPETPDVPPQPQQQTPYTPPAYAAAPPGAAYGAPPRRGGVPGWVWGLIAGGCGCFLFIVVPIFAAILFPVFAKAREKARQSVCISNLKQISLAALMYAEDNDGRLPPAKTWSDPLREYAAEPKPGDTAGIFHCPEVRSEGSFGYAYNSALSLKPLSKIGDPKQIRLVYDSATLTANAADAGTSLPVPGRHSRGNDIAYADGHVKWVRDAAP